MLSRNLVDLESGSPASQVQREEVMLGRHERGLGWMKWGETGQAGVDQLLARGEWVESWLFTLAV